METDRHTDRHRDTRADRKTERERETQRQTDIQPGRQTPAFFAIPLEELELLGQFSVWTKPQLLGQWWPHVGQSCLLT